jgi:hypothetical protein
VPYTDYLSSCFESKAAKFSSPFYYKFESFPFVESVNYLREESASGASLLVCKGNTTL